MIIDNQNKEEIRYRQTELEPMMKQVNVAKALLIGLDVKINNYIYRMINDNLCMVLQNVTDPNNVLEHIVGCDYAWDKMTREFLDIDDEEYDIMMANMALNMMKMEKLKANVPGGN